MPPHDFKNFPELTNAQVDFYYFDSPHKQIFEDFFCIVTKVIDGDTIRVKWSERDFDFPIRFLNLAASELNEGGEESQSWLESQILGKEVEVRIDQENRVEKWGRLLGEVFFNGISMSEMSILTDNGVAWKDRNQGKFNLDKLLKSMEV